MATGTLLRGTILLTVSGLLTRTIAFLYNAYLIRITGSEGIGIYQMVLPLYFTMLTVSCAGIPYAVAKLVSEERSGGSESQPRQTLLTAMMMLAVTGGFTAGVMYQAAGFLSTRTFTDPRTGLVIALLSPALFLATISAGLRGYFAGMQKMFQVAQAQVLDQLIHSAVAVTLVLLLAERGIGYVAIALAIGMISGETTALAVLLGSLARHRHKHEDGRREGARSRDGQHTPMEPERWYKTLRRSSGWQTALPLRILKLAVPLAIGSVIAGAVQSVNTVIIPARLVKGGLAVQEATAQLGQLAGIAFPLMMFPNIINMALATNLVPSISRALAAKDYQTVKRQTQKAVNLTIFLGLPVSSIIAVLSRPICSLIFGFPEAAPVVTLTALGAPFLYVWQTTAGILQGLGKPGLSVRSYVIGTLADTAIVYPLAAMPGIGIKGAAISSTINCIVGAVLNLKYLFKLTGFRLDPKTQLLRPALISLVLTLSAYWLWRVLGAS